MSTERYNHEVNVFLLPARRETVKKEDDKIIIKDVCGMVLGGKIQNKDCIVVGETTECVVEKITGNTEKIKFIQEKECVSQKEGNVTFYFFVEDDIGEIEVLSESEEIRNNVNENSEKYLSQAFCAVVQIVMKYVTDMVPDIENDIYLVTFKKVKCGICV